MSIAVALADLRAATERYEWAYLLTVRDDLTPHVVAVSPTWDGDTLVVAVGRGGAANAAVRSSITLCYPPAEPGEHSLIVDGAATVDPASAAGAAVVRFHPTGAVLHRPATPGTSGGSTGCGSDCAPVTST